MAGPASIAPGLRRRLAVQLDPELWPKTGISPLNALLVAVILLATLTGILATEPAVMARYGALYPPLEMTFGIIFIVEYAVRFWVAPEREPAKGAARRRWEFVKSPTAIIDIIVIASTFGSLFVEGALLLRLVRLMRIFALAKLGRASRALAMLQLALYERRFELYLTLGLAVFLLVIGASALYWIEGAVQPDAFGSIPRALWWSIITLTTVGYGDVSPITPLGKSVAALVAVSGIGLVAMPTGILAAAFSDAMQRRREIEQLAAAEDAPETI